MPDNKAPTLETKTFRLEHSGGILECNDSFPSFSLLSKRPNQLWSSCFGEKGQWVINRGTGEYLVVDNSKAGMKIEIPYEWNMQNDGPSVRLQDVSQNIFLQSSQQKVAVSPLRDADSLFNITCVTQPVLSVGSENYLKSPEHTCVTNHVFNAVNALNAIIHILEHPDSTLPVDIMAIRFRNHLDLFKARGKEATQNLEFARETVASWFTVIGAKMDVAVNKKGSIEILKQIENPRLKGAEKQLEEVRVVHVKTKTDLKEQEKRFKNAQDNYESAKKHFDSAEEKEDLAKGSYDEAQRGGDPDEAASLGRIWSEKEADSKGAKAAKNSRKSELDHERGLLNTLKAHFAQELTDIAKLENDVQKAEIFADDGGDKIVGYQKHHETLTTLHGLLKDCREHLAETLRYNVGGGASLSGVRKMLKGVIDVLERGEDFKEPLKILDRAALEHLMARIPAIASHSTAGKLSN
ncbi:hypothetical protein CPB83DRAFT_87947 [Crepidotus variabilis]|uniref:Uncharacterized protein n=1 Tax=Crepidotus variabilis TaxID=179855 RepID=A0A9P6EMT2_9AGAR|nr:hypothetical protein CPB83DRAFT_87947 [Crepidotus variabilis]